ncbi:hypothetical protein HGRIS_007885 [Hohenbuehelia grisea]|uniref:Uncharacterized protein n=1 Tax=Hohenbuehelia grisea TaxID=104357 RepID=A0ABR3J675_9AGAR
MHLRLCLCLFLSLLALVQGQSSQSQQQSQSQNARLTTILSASVTLGPNRQESTVTVSIVSTIAGPQQSGSPGRNSTSGNSTTSGNNTASASASSSSPTSPLPTAPNEVDGGGRIGAPIPGAKAGGGIYGPNDDYIAAGSRIGQNTVLIGLIGFMVGGGLILL